MKNPRTGTLVAALSACLALSHGARAEEPPGGEVAESIRAFEEICLKTAPDFSAAAQAAASFGIVDIIDEGAMKMGGNKDDSLGLQIKPGKECVITTPSQASGVLTKQFFQAIGRHATVPPAQRLPTKANIKGTPFIFQHDRDGGEAFVMLKANG